MTIRLGCCAFNFNAWPLDGALRLVRDLGLGHADVSAGQLGGQGAVADDPHAAARRVREAAERAGVALCEFFVCGVEVDERGVEPSHPDAATRARMLERFHILCRAARLAGFESIMGIPGKQHEGVEPARCWDTAVATLAQMVRIARDEGVRLNVEPGMGSLAGNPSDALRLARAVPGLTYSLDYAHYIGQGIAVSEILPVHEFAAHIHVKQARPGLIKALCHHGTIDFAPIVADLLQRGWDGVMTMECIGYTCDDPAIGWPAYREVTPEWQSLPPDRGLVSHPVYQTVLHAQAIDGILRGG